MIYHILPGTQFKHLGNYVIQMQTFSALDHFYITVCSTNQQKEMFEELFRERSITQYRIYNSQKPLFLFRELLFAKVWFDLLKKHRKDIVVFHGTTLRCMFSLILLWLRLFKSFYTVNWGYVRIKSNKHGSVIYQLVQALKKYVFVHELQGFHVITLMEPDRRVVKVYNPRSVVCIPYPSRRNHVEFSGTRTNENILLLGNSRWYIKSYIELLEKIPDFRNNNHVKILYSYGPEPSETIM